MKAASVHKKVFAFIDSQNLHLGIKYDVWKERRLVHKGWDLDFKKFRAFLTHSHRVDKAFLFIGYLKNNEALYDYLKRTGYILIFKPTVEYKSHNKLETKGT